MGSEEKENEGRKEGGGEGGYKEKKGRKEIGGIGAEKEEGLYLEGEESKKI